MYDCPRCGYSTNKKTNFRRHVYKKKVCKPLLLDIMITKEKVIGILYDNKKIYECYTCKRTFTRIDNMHRHYKECKQPDKEIVEIRSTVQRLETEIFKIKEKVKSQKENNRKQNRKKNHDLEFIYIIKLREHVLLKQDIYKIGRTNRKPSERHSEYPKDSICYFSYDVTDSKNTESKMIKLFSRDFVQRTDIGREYFEGSLIEMIEKFNRIILL